MPLSIEVRRSCLVNQVSYWLDSLDLYCSEDDIQLAASSDDHNVFSPRLTILLEHGRRVQKDFEQWYKEADGSSPINHSLRVHVNRAVIRFIAQGTQSGSVGPMKLELVRRILAGFELSSLQMGLGWSERVVAKYRVSGEEVKIYSSTKKSSLENTMCAAEKIYRSTKRSSLENTMCAAEKIYRSTKRSSLENALCAAEASREGSVSLDSSDEEEEEVSRTSKRSHSRDLLDHNVPTKKRSTSPGSDPFKEMVYKRTTSLLVGTSGQQEAQSPVGFKSILTKALGILPAKFYRSLPGSPLPSISGSTLNRSIRGGN